MEHRKRLRCHEQSHTASYGSSTSLRKTRNEPTDFEKLRGKVEGSITLENVE